VLAARRQPSTCSRRWAQVRDLPAHRRPLPLRDWLPRRVGRDLRSGVCCPTTGLHSTPHDAGSWASSWFT
jgi:hypothetical protein